MEGGAGASALQLLSTGSGKAEPELCRQLQPPWRRGPSLHRQRERQASGVAGGGVQEAWRQGPRSQVRGPGHPAGHPAEGKGMSGTCLERACVCTYTPMCTHTHTQVLIYMHVHTCILTNMHGYAHTYMHAHMHTPTRMCICMCTQLRAFTQIHSPSCMHTHLCAYMHRHPSTCMCVHTSMHTHAHLPTCMYMHTHLYAYM